MFILLNYIAINAQSINESFTVENGSDTTCVLKFYNSKQYEYYREDLNKGELKIVEKGTYQKNKNKIVLNPLEQIDSVRDTIPKVLYYSRMSKKAFEKIGSKLFVYEIKNYILLNRYHVLTTKQ